MSLRTTRRQFLQTASSAAVAGPSLLAPHRLAHAAPATPCPLPNDIEPLVRLIEETPRERLLEEIGTRVLNGLSYQEVLAGLQLAGVREVQPRPSVGHKFHAVLGVNSAYLASVASPERDRWVPLFWALDYFKSAQAADIGEGNWTMGPADEASLPAPDRARQTFCDAMDRWDEPAADPAIVALARSAGAGEVFDLLARYGARDFRSIGHKAIFVSNGRRAFDAVGWRYAEPVLRSMAYALLMHEGGNPAEGRAAADLPYRRNLELVKTMPAAVPAGPAKHEATLELLAVLREGSDEDASRTVAELLVRGESAQTVWDGLFCAAAELLLRQPGIVALHSVTTTNALHFAWQTATKAETRNLLLLQNAAFLPLFRQAMSGRGGVGDARIDQLEPEPSAQQTGAMEEIFADVSGNVRRAVPKAMAWLEQADRAEPSIREARALTVAKGNHSHAYKFSSAVLEDAYHVSTAWRPRYLAASLVQLFGTGQPDSPLLPRTRLALGQAVVQKP